MDFYSCLYFYSDQSVSVVSKSRSVLCELFKADEIWWVENSSKSLQYGVPSGHLVTFPDAVLIAEEACVYT